MTDNGDDSDKVSTKDMMGFFNMRKVELEFLFWGSIEILWVFEVIRSECWLYGFRCCYEINPFNSIYITHAW